MVSVRTKCDKIGMWLAVAGGNQAESITTVGRRVKERLSIDPHVSKACDQRCRAVQSSKLTICSLLYSMEGAGPDYVMLERLATWLQKVDKEGFKNGQKFVDVIYGLPLN